MDRCIRAVRARNRHAPDHAPTIGATAIPTALSELASAQSFVSSSIPVFPFAEIERYIHAGKTVAHWRADHACHGPSTGAVTGLEGTAGPERAAVAPQDGRVCAIKVYRFAKDAAASRATAQRTHEALQAYEICAKRGGLTISRPLAFNDELCAVAMTWIGGVRSSLLLPMLPPGARRRQLFEIGAWLGAFHAGSAAEVGGLPFTSTVAMIRHYVKQARSPKIADQFARAVKLGREIEASYPDASGMQVWLHTDFIARNIRIQSGRIGVFDIEYVVRGPARHDLATFMVEYDARASAYVRGARLGLLSGSLDSFLDGYASRAALPDRESLAAMYYLRSLMKMAELAAAVTTGPRWARSWLIARRAIGSRCYAALARDALSIAAPGERNI